MKLNVEQIRIAETIRSNVFSSGRRCADLTGYVGRNAKRDAQVYERMSHEQILMSEKRSSEYSDKKKQDFPEWLKNFQERSRSADGDLIVSAR